MAVKQFTGKVDTDVLIQTENYGEAVSVYMVDGNGARVHYGCLLSICQGPNGIFLKLDGGVGEDFVDTDEGGFIRVDRL